MPLSEKSSWKSPRRLALIAGVVTSLLLGLWFSAPAPGGDVLVLDAAAMTVVLDELPATEEAARARAEEEISNVTGVPAEEVERHFTLLKSSRTQYEWQLVYTVSNNPDLAVSLVHRITADEGYAIADEYLKDLLGTAYFSAHFTPERFDSVTNTVHYSFVYPLPGDEFELPMWVRVSYERTVTGRQVVTGPQEITIARAQADELAQQQGVPEPFSSTPFLKSGILCWRVVWQHTPNDADYELQRLYGVEIHATTGELITILRYVRPTPASSASPVPITSAQITALLAELGVTGLEDGASFDVRVFNGSDEVFAVTRSFGRLVVQQGANANADITLWLDRELIVQALQAADTLAYLQEHANGRNVRVELHANAVILQKKGYLELYERLQG
ncbi:MAG: hypothetical protein JW945_01355 [Methanomicrobia archaeon]|nr:hypothetical protein [Methanomicrobia archaeon]